MIDNISSVSNNFYNPQITNKVANVNSANLANNAANQSAFSSYIGQALAQLGVANPTNSNAPVISSANSANTSEKSLSTFIQDLFDILSKNDVAENSTAPVTEKFNQSQTFSEETTTVTYPTVENRSSDNETVETNVTAIEAYTADNSTTVGNIIANLQKLVDKLNLNDSTDSQQVQTLQNDFQSILDAQGATTENPTSLATFLQTLAQNLEGQSPLGIIINTQA
jgi:hypothetical protein